MKIYGVALLSACFLIGKLVGRFLGQVLNINSDVGGVGFAMFLLMVSSLYLRKKDGGPKSLKVEFLFGVQCTFPL